MKQPPVKHSLFRHPCGHMDSATQPPKKCSPDLTKCSFALAAFVIWAAALLSLSPYTSDSRMPSLANPALRFCALQLKWNFAGTGHLLRSKMTHVHY